MTKAFKTGDVDIRNDLCANVVLSGGTTIFQGIGERVTLSFEFPDGNIISVGAKRFRCAGVLLPPSLICQCDVDIRKDLHANVVFSGGTTIFQGIGERVTLAFEFTDGNIIIVGAKRFRCKEVLLQPRFFYQCDGDIRKDLYTNETLVILTTR